MVHLEMKKFHIVLFLYILFMVKLCQYGYSNNIFHTFTKNKNSNELKKEIQILIWDPTPFPTSGQWWWDFSFKSLINKQCPESRCRISHNRSMYKEADAVVFGAFSMTYYDKMQIPETHPTGQLWVLYSTEAAFSDDVKRSKVLNATVLERTFNWTMHFRKDSDVLAPYGLVKKVDTQKVHKAYNSSDVWSRKDKRMIASWMVSHCSTSSKRETYVKELKKHVRVDIYGGCSKLKCGCTQIEASSSGPRCPMEECTHVTNSYFFDLAFENTICREYATDRLYRSLQRDVIPVVMGAADYEKIAPPHSVIDIRDFQSPKHLADYLKKVASDQVLFNKYFEWKPYYSIELGHPYAPKTCDLCEKLHKYRSAPTSMSTVWNTHDWIHKDGCQGTWRDVLAKKYPHG